MTAVARATLASVRGRILWSIVVVQGAVHALAVVALFFPSQAAILASVATYLFVGNFGVTLGYHRLLAHRAFRAHPLVEGTLALIGVLALQGGPLRWACMHRAHHVHVDGEGDPHASSRGFLWSHQAWSFFRRPNGFSLRDHGHLTRDLERSAWLRFLETHAFSINIVAFAGGMLLLGWQMALWVFPVRIAALWHATWSINSVTHGASLRPQTKPIESESARNVPWLAPFTFGEAWHRNHHDRPSAPVFVDRPWQFDLGGWTLLLLRRLGIARLRTTDSNP